MWAITKSLILFFIVIGAVFVWQWLSTGVMPSFNIMTFVGDVISNIFCIVWYLIRFILVMIVNVTTEVLGLGSFLNYPSYSC